MEPQRSDTDLTDEPFALVEPFRPRPKKIGTPPANPHAVLYRIRTGCPWRMRPHDCPPWSTVHTWYRPGRSDGTGDRIHKALRPAVRRRAGRHPSPRSAADSQSVKTAEAGGERGSNSGKRVKGRERHLWVDSTGLLLAVLVTAAAAHDSCAGGELFHRRLWEELPRLSVVEMDSGSTAGYLEEEGFSWSPLERVVVSRPEGWEGWVRLPQRWVVGGTLGWQYRSRRRSKGDERDPESSGAMVRVSRIPLLLRRRASVPQPYSQRFRYRA